MLCDIMVPMVDELFSDWLMNEMRERGWNQAELARRSGVTRQAIGQIEGMNRAVHELDLQIARIVSAITAAGHSSAMLAELGELEGRRDELQTSINELEYEDKRKRDTKVPEFGELANKIAKVLDKAGINDRRQLISDYVYKITAQKNTQIEGQIVFKLPMYGDVGRVVDI